MGASIANTLGYGTPQSAAQSSIAFGAGGTGMEALGSLFGGIGGYQQAAYAASLSRQNAGFERQNAVSTLRAGVYEEAVSKLRTGETIGAQKAAQGANNIDVNVGSAKAVQQSTAEIGAIDAAMIHYNAAKQAYGYESEATGLTAQSKLQQQAGWGALEAGVFKAGGGLLSGASSLGQKYATFQYLGANNTAGGSAPISFAGP